MLDCLFFIYTDIYFYFFSNVSRYSLFCYFTSTSLLITFKVHNLYTLINQIKIK